MAGTKSYSNSARVLCASVKEISRELYFVQPDRTPRRTEKKLEAQLSSRDPNARVTSAERRALDEIKELNRNIGELQLEESRGFNGPGFKDLSDRVNKRSATRMSGRGPSKHTAGQLAPLQFPDEELRRTQTAAQRGENCRIETRNSFSTADSLLPAELFPYPIAAQHEDRLLDYLPGYEIDTPSITFIQHVSTTGAPGPVDEGAQKPEIILNTDALTATAVKLAAHTGLSWEIINDWPSFHSYAGTELYKQIIDLENNTLIQGALNESGYTPDNSFEGFTGFLATPGILTYNASGDTGGSGASSLTALVLQP